MSRDVVRGFLLIVVLAIPVAIVIAALVILSLLMGRAP